MEAFSAGPCVLLTHPTILGSLPYFVAVQDFPGAYTFSALALRFSNLQRTLDPFCGEWYSETKIWELGVFIAIGVLLISNIY